MEPGASSIHLRRARLRDRIRAGYASDPHLEGDGTYDHPLWIEAMQPLIARCAPQSEGPILDVGCGSGGFSRFLAAQTGGRVLGIDIDDRSVQRARILADERGLTALVEHRVIDAEAAAPPFPEEAFSAVVCSKVACHFVNPLETLRTWRTWLAPGGFVGIVDGLWQVAGWTGLGHLLDDLPIPCQQTLGTISYLLEEAGFSIEYRSRLEQVNAATARGELPAMSGPLYLVVAHIT